MNRRGGLQSAAERDTAISIDSLLGSARVSIS